MTEFEKFVAALKSQWIQKRSDTGLTFQEFLLALLVFHTQEKDNG